MAFNKKTWKDRLSEFATRRILTDQDTGTVSVVEVARSEGTIYQQGDAFSAENMNDLEDRIEDAIENVTAVDGPMTDAEYDELTEAEKMDGTIRVVGSENEDDMMAAAVTSYDNTDSGLQADDVQGAIDEINQNLTEKIDTFFGTVEDEEHTTYSAITADGIAYDSVNEQLLLKVNGADTVIPFSKGSKIRAIAVARATVYAYATLDANEYGFANSITGDWQSATFLDNTFSFIHHATSGWALYPEAGQSISGKRISVASQGNSWEDFTINSYSPGNMDGYIFVIY